MGLKMGLVLGLVVGAALAGLAGKKKIVEGPDTEELSALPASGAQRALREAIERLRFRANQALEAAHEAADEKEAELRRRYRHLSEQDA